MFSQVKKDLSNEYAALDHRLLSEQSTFCGLRLNSYGEKPFKARIGRKAGYGKWLNVSENWLTVNCQKCLAQRYKVLEVPTQTFVREHGKVSLRSVLFREKQVANARAVKPQEKGKVFDERS